MDARLVAIGGPLSGKSFPVTEEELLIGRGKSNAVYHNYPRVSRRHCLVKREGEGFKITDLDSFNGTFVNDVPIKGHFLKHGDQIKIISSLFLSLLDDGEEVSLSNWVALDERPLLS